MPDRKTADWNLLRRGKDHMAVDYLFRVLSRADVAKPLARQDWGEICGAIDIAGCQSLDFDQFCRLYNYRGPHRRTLLKSLEAVQTNIPEDVDE